MEKFSQFRDRGSGVAPFFPVAATPSRVYLPIHVFLFAVRLPFFLALTLGYFAVLQWLPLGSLSKKALLWMILGVPGIWWIDLQVDGVKKGNLAKHSPRLPKPSNIIASSLTSPIDALYLAAIFDPIFTASYPHTRQLERISLLTAILRALSPPRLHPPPGARLTSLAALLAQNPQRIVVVFPETTTTNGRGVLRFSPSLLSAPPAARIFPVSLRYTPPDITTPLPGLYAGFLWNLLSRPTHCIRVRIAEYVYNNPALSLEGNGGGVSRSPPPQSQMQHQLKNPYTANFLDTLQQQGKGGGGGELKRDSNSNTGEDDDATPFEKKLLEKVGEALARLGRVQRVGLGVEDKVAFVEAWERSRRRRR